MRRKLALPLTHGEQRVFEAVAALGPAGSTTCLRDIARRSEFDAATVQRALHSLTTHHNIVSEVAPEVSPDLGSQYVLHDYE